MKIKISIMKKWSQEAHRGLSNRYGFVVAHMTNRRGEGKDAVNSVSADSTSTS